jgi:hypothetical protein
MRRLPRPVSILVRSLVVLVVGLLLLSNARSPA